MSHLTLKWRTLKAWDFPDSEEGQKLLKEYFELGSSMSAMMQKDSKRQKEILCELIDICDDPKGIYLDWDGKYVSKEEAKKYVLGEELTSSKVVKCMACDRWVDVEEVRGGTCEECIEHHFS